MFKAKIIRSQVFVLCLYVSVIFVFYFLIPWIKGGTVYFFRWDEGPYLYIFKKIGETGYIPNELNYIGGIPNYIYPNLYLLLSSTLIFVSKSLNLMAASLILQGILFITLSVSALTLYKLVTLVSKNSLTSFLAGLFYIVLPIASYRLFYLHATFYANFVGMMFLLLFLFYLTKYRIEENKKTLLLSIFFYSLTLFTHQLVFMMATVILGIDFLIEVVTKRKLRAQIVEKFFFGSSAVLINLGYILRTPIFAKILSVLGIEKSSQFGQEVVVKSSAEALPQIVPNIILGISLVAVILIFVKRKKLLYGVSLFHVFIISPVLLSVLNINLPASFRYDSFYIITIPILLSYFLSLVKDINIKLIVATFVLVLFSLRISTITNGFSLDELTSLKTGLHELNCNNTVSYFRIAPWIPVLSNSSIYYAHVDIYNAHQDKSDQEMAMFSNEGDQNKRFSLMKEKKVDCIVYEKAILVVDNIRVKGWERWRYADLYPVSSSHYEDKNLVIFKFKNNT